MAYAFRVGRAVPAKPQGHRTTGELKQHKQGMWSRLERLRRRGIVPTADENNQSINLEHLLNYLEENFPPGHPRESGGTNWANRPGHSATDDLPEDGRPKSKDQASAPGPATTREAAPADADAPSATDWLGGEAQGADVDDEQATDSPEEEILFDGSFSEMPPACGS